MTELAITLNGEPRRVAGPVSLDGLLRHLGLDPKAHVVGMDFPGNSLKSGYFPEEEFALQLRGWIERARSWGFATLVLVNGHGAQNHNATIERLVQAYRPPETAIDVLGFLALTTGHVGSLNIGHATADETSLMLFDHPGDVALDLLPPSDQPLKSADFAVVDDLTFRGQPTPSHTLRREDDPRTEADAERGRAVREQTVTFICESLAAFLRDRDHAIRTNLACEL
jgi:creatinine amidohydrolase/Fe(II)-dependent formamide hydrolase-like protein